MGLMPYLYQEENLSMDNSSFLSIVFKIQYFKYRILYQLHLFPFSLTVCLINIYVLRISYMPSFYQVLGTHE